MVVMAANLASMFDVDLDQVTVLKCSQVNIMHYTCKEILLGIVELKELKAQWGLFQVNL